MREHPLLLIDYANMEWNDVVDQLTSLDEFDAEDDAELETHELATHLYGFQHTRLLLSGSDHADLLGHTYLLEVVQVVYDQSLFYSDEEYMARTGKSVNVQVLVEAPFIRLLSMSGSSALPEQLRLVPDRAADLHCTRAQLDRQVGDPITVSLVGYIGDLHGRWFEAGVHKGGEYRCRAGCGCPSSKLQYYSSNNSSPLPSLQNLQQRAIAGIHGRTPGKNLHYLSLTQLRTELTRRGVRGVRDKYRPQLVRELRALLRGVQRVLALLAFTPRAHLSRFALENYQVMPCEPLHDLKGHISHLLKELPSHLSKEAECEIDRIVQETVREHNRGCDWRKALLLCASAVHGEELLLYCSGSVRRLLRRLAEIASIVYSRD